ncbi:hypothetical protein GCM10018791_72040 [Streptomyces zaomyceticus]|nr:hypothetical protein GCM10018791_72040 [Streptomyces zaomyceticus]
MQGAEVLVDLAQHDERVAAFRDGHGTLLAHTAPACRSLLTFMLRPPPGPRTPEGVHAG